MTDGGAGLGTFNKEQALQNYALTLREDAHSRTQHLAWARRFLASSSGHMDRFSAIEWRRDLQNKGYSDGSVRWGWQMLRRLYVSNGMPWPFLEGEAPIIRESDVYAPALHPDAIRQMIRAACEGVLKPEETAVVALGTVYGVRRIEVASLTPQDIRPQEGLIFIHTAKKGRQRWHKLPEVLVPFLDGWSGGLSVGKVHTLYLLAEYRAGVEHIKGVGLHSHRRTLTTLLSDKLPEMVVKQYLRWSPGSMAQRYRAVTFVGGPKGKEIALDSEDKRTDDQVFHVHPFLQDWGWRPAQSLERDLEEMGL